MSCCWTWVAADALALLGVMVHLAVVVVSKLLALVVPHPDDRVLASWRPASRVQCGEGYISLLAVTKGVAVVHQI